VVLGLATLLFARVLPVAAEFTAQGIYLSLYLAVFNMIPVPPLDGSKLLLAARVPVAVYNELARFGFLLLIILISSTGFGRWMSMLSLQGTERILGLFVS